VIIHFELDLNGMLKVTATEKGTGLAKTVTLDTRQQARALNLEEARRNVAQLVRADSPAPPPGAPAPEAQPDAPADLLTTAKDLRKRGEALLQKNLSPDDAEEIRLLIHSSAAAITERNWPALRERNDTLSDLVFYLED
jgi:molecular chaperone DnaK